MKRIVLFSYHYYQSQRRAGFHWLADAFWQQGWEVVFVTAPVSWLHRLSGNFRFQYPVRKEANRLREIRDRFFSYVLFSSIHPANFRSPILNNLLQPLVARYARLPLGELAASIETADMVVFESTPALLLVQQVREINPRAKIVYRVSDDIRLLDLHPMVITAETELLPLFDLISVPSEFLYQRFSHLPTTHLQYHGLSKDLFSQNNASPYTSPGNAVYVGNHPYLDRDCLHTAATLFPDLQFHIIGDTPEIPPRENIRIYGEMPFQETIPFLQHADIGLHPVSYVRGAESSTDSLKVLQYSHCGLPIIMPNFIPSSRGNVFHYRPGEEDSIKNCFQAALTFTPNGKPAQPPILSWTELAQEINHTSQMSE